MDIPTLIVLVASVSALAVFLVVRVCRISRVRALLIECVSVSFIWFLLTLGGEFIFKWAGNATCSKYLGCVDGFGGYDAFEHLFFGVAAALAILWFCERYPTRSFLPAGKWKAALVAFSIVALLAMCWEILEYMHDTIELDIFHQQLVNWRLHINNLDQPSNNDTVGDIAFALMGALIALVMRIRTWRFRLL